MDKEELKLFVETNIEHLKILSETDNNKVIDVLKTVVENFHLITPSENDSETQKEVLKKVKSIKKKSILYEISELETKNMVYIEYNYVMIRGTLGSVLDIIN
ncbi:hypothetical protein [Winogradskyella psychrotolerans]|uniref:hypothetical protein n=1 Tax=Winogradskyella psychrotolerans TaxID=1344585 RepID=UPI001C066AD1|nr:hypothetical protein [Winogradskyella psychrotolerans]MBU2928031.1 hypothetical protein [Winogradskyella psychrotolerans]